MCDFLVTWCNVIVIAHLQTQICKDNPSLKLCFSWFWYFQFPNLPELLATKGTYHLHNEYIGNAHVWSVW